MAVLLTPPYLQFFDDDGVPLAGGFVYTYTATGTFSVPKATYTTAAGNIEAPNPVELDASGRPTTGNGGIWISGTYDFKVTDSLNNIIETQLNVTAFNALPPTGDPYFESFSGNGSQTAFTTSEDLGTDEKAIYVWVDSGLQQNVTNGNFATDTGWTKGSGWTIAAGVATATGAISTALSQTSAVTIVASEAYVLTYTVTRSAGGIIPSIGGASGVERTASGTYTEVISSGTTQALAFTGNAFTGTLDNISITVANSKGYDIQNPANYTINGTALTFVTAPAAGTGNIYVSAPSLLVGAASSSAADAAASAANAMASELAAADSETAAAASAATAASYAASLSSTSTTSLAIATGAKTFTTQAGKQYIAGQYLIASSAASALNYMHGTVTSYSGTTLIMNITDIGGSGTLADWNISLSGTQGPIGATGPAGASSSLPNGGYVSGVYYNGFHPTTDGGADTLVADRLYAGSFLVASTNTFDRISIEVVTTGTATGARLGIYNTANGKPTTLLLDGGTVVVSSTGQKDLTISQSLSAGVYWIAIVLNGTCDVYGYDGTTDPYGAYVGGAVGGPGGGAPAGYYGSHTYGVLPSNFPATTVSAALYPVLILRSA